MDIDKFYKAWATCNLDCDYCDFERICHNMRKDDENEPQSDKVEEVDKCIEKDTDVEPNANDDDLFISEYGCTLVNGVGFSPMSEFCGECEVGRCEVCQKARKQHEDNTKIVLYNQAIYKIQNSDKLTPYEKDKMVEKILKAIETIKGCSIENWDI